MNLVVWAYLVFLLNVIAGFVLFFGFLLRKRRFPLGWTLAHIGLGAVTLLIFTLAGFH